MTTTITPEQQALAARILSGDFTPEQHDIAPIVMADRSGFHADIVPDVHALIAAASASMGVKPVEKPGQVEAADPNAINTLVALAAEHARQEKFHKEQRDAIKQALEAMIVKAEEQAGESIDALTVHGAKVFTYSVTRSRVLNQAAVKQAFPDVDDYAEFYKDQVTRTARFA